MRQNGGIMALLGFAAAYVVLRRFAPSFAGGLLRLGLIAGAAIFLLVAGVLWLALRRPEEKENKVARDGAAVLQQGRIRLLDIRRTGAKIGHGEIRAINERICATMEKILQKLRQQPEDIDEAGRFFRYYLPTLQSILNKYLHLEQGGVPAEDIQQKTVACLREMEEAMKKQYGQLFEAEKMDLAAEMVVMTRIFRADGLLDSQAPFAGAAEQDEADILQVQVEGEGQ